MKPKLNYNERSWAIDVIGYIKTYTNKKNKLIQDAGGEQTVIRRVVVYSLMFCCLETNNQQKFYKDGS